MTAPVVRRSIAALKLPKRVPDLISIVRGIVRAVTGNPAFPSPVPSLAAVGAALADLEVAQAVAEMRGKGAAEARDQTLRALVALVQLLRAYVQNVGDADWENASGIIESAGMQVKRVGVRARREFAVKPGVVSGSVVLVTAAAAKRASYDWAVSADESKTWQALPTTLQSETRLAGLQPGTTYWFRYRAVTKAGVGDWSQVVATMVT
jgi:hypothetical protein